MGRPGLYRGGPKRPSGGPRTGGRRAPAERAWSGSGGPGERRVLRDSIRRLFRFLPALAAFALVLTSAAPAHAGQEEDKAADLVYEAADAIDEALAHLRAGRQRGADRKLSEAERFLDEAERLDPHAAGVTFQRARLHQADGDPAAAEALLLREMTRRLDVTDHTAAVSMLDRARGDLGRVPVGAAWKSASGARNGGIGVLAGGLVAAGVGFGIAFDTLAAATYDNTAAAGGPQTAGWVLAGVGGGLSAGGAGLLIGGQFQLDALRKVLPGPWRLPGGSLEAGGKVSKKARETARTRGRL